LLFQFIAPALYDRPLRLWLVLSNSTVPVMLWVASQYRFPVSRECLKHQHETETKLASRLHEIVVLYPLIADYNRRPYFVEKYERLVNNVNDATRTSACVMANNQYLAIWLTTLSVAAFTLFGGMLVINGSMTLGMFLANVRIFADVGKASKGVYLSWLEVQRVLPSLMRITRLLNLPVDVDERKEFSDLMERVSREHLARQVQEGLDSADILNLMPITFSNISIRFHAKRDLLTFRGDIVIEQGNIVVIIGPRSSGKSTFLKALGGAILPKQTEGVFMPSHLRVLHLHPEALFFEGSLLENLTFGIKRGCKGGDEQRVRRICKELGISDEVLSYLGDHQATHLPWNAIISNTHKVLLHLARALIASPHVLLLHRPMEIFDATQQTRIMDVLRKFVDERGLEQDDWAQPWALRPRRTCIVESARVNVIRGADQVIYLKGNSMETLETEDIRIETVMRESILEEMLG